MSIRCKIFGHKFPYILCEPYEPTKFNDYLYEVEEEYKNCAWRKTYYDRYQILDRTRRPCLRCSFNHDILKKYLYGRDIKNEI